MRRVVITGLGAVSAVGTTPRAAFDNLVAGVSGVTAWNAVGRASSGHAAAPISDLDPTEVLGYRNARRHARFTLLSVASAKTALADAGIDNSSYEPNRIATILGVGFGGLEVLHREALIFAEHGPPRMHPFGIPAAIPNTAAGMVAGLIGAAGPCFTVSSACASSAHAIGEATRMVRHGVVDAAVTGGSEACLEPLAMTSFGRMGTLATWTDDPKRACRPFDVARTGFVLGEGGATLVLETLEGAQRRGAAIYAEVLGYGASADVHHPTDPDPTGRGAARAMHMALADARRNPTDIQYINAHGTGTKLNDVAETRAIKNVFRAHSSELWVSSTKSMTGHMMGGAGAFEALVCALSLRESVVPPTINLDQPDPECDLDYVPHQARPRSLRTVMTNSFGFGGQNASLVLGELE